MLLVQRQTATVSHSAADDGCRDGQVQDGEPGGGDGEDGGRREVHRRHRRRRADLLLEEKVARESISKKRIFKHQVNDFNFCQLIFYEILKFFLSHTLEIIFNLYSFSYLLYCNQ